MQSTKLHLCNPLQLNKPAQLRNHHPFHTFNAAGQCWTIAGLILALHVIPNLTIGAFTIPTKVSVRDGVYRKILKTAEQSISFRDINLTAKHFNAHQFFVRVEQISRNLFRIQLVSTLVAHRQRQYNRSQSNC
jgi:hypothetical protein